MEDAGNYECRVLLSNGTLYKQATVNLALSPTKGQIRVCLFLTVELKGQ